MHDQVKILSLPRPKLLQVFFLLNNVITELLGKEKYYRMT